MKEQEKTFRGFRIKDQCFVTLNDEPFDPIPFNGLPQKFDWGNDSLEARQLAYAILCNIYDIDIASRFYLDFAEEIIADWYIDKWTFPECIIREQMKRIYKQKAKAA